MNDNERTPDQRNIDHDLLIELKTKLDGVLDALKELKDGTAARIEDHEKRIRFIERYVSGAIAVGVVAEIAARIYFK